VTALLLKQGDFTPIKKDTIMAESCSIDKCPHESKINSLQNNHDNLVTLMREVRDDVRDVKTNVLTIRTLEVEHTHTKETMGRLFSRVEVLERERLHVDDLDTMTTRIVTEKARESYDAFVNQVQGMKQLAWALWTIMAGGVGLLIFKFMQVTGTH